MIDVRKEEVRGQCSRPGQCKADKGGTASVLKEPDQVLVSTDHNTLYVTNSGEL